MLGKWSGEGGKPNQKNRLVFRYYGFQFFFSLLLWLPIFYDYQEKLGLSHTQIAQIQSVYYISFCLIEIPTGILADRWGRLNCLRLGSLICLISNLLPVFADFSWPIFSWAAPTWMVERLTAPSFIYDEFLGHFFLLALARSLISGASSAYLYDHLQASGDAQDFKRVEGRARSYGLLGKVLVWPLTGWMMSYHLSLPYVLTAVGSALAIGFAWGLPADYTGTGDLASPAVSNLSIHRKTQPAPHPEGDFSSASSHFLRWLAEIQLIFRVLFQSPMLFLIILQGIAIFVLSRICQVNLFHPLLILKSFDRSVFGSVMALMTIFEALGSAYPNWLRKQVHLGLLKLEIKVAASFRSTELETPASVIDLHCVFLCTGVAVVSLFALTGAGQLGTLVGLSVFSLAVGACFPIQRQLLNDFIPEARYRATLMSFESILDRAACAWAVALLGGFIAEGQIGKFLQYSAALTGAGIVLLFFLAYWFRFSLFKGTVSGQAAVLGEKL